MPYVPHSILRWFRQTSTVVNWCLLERRMWAPAPADSQPSLLGKNAGRSGGALPSSPRELPGAQESGALERTDSQHPCLNGRPDR